MCWCCKNTSLLQKYSTILSVPNRMFLSSLVFYSVCTAVVGFWFRHKHVFSSAEMLNTFFVYAPLLFCYYFSSSLKVSARRLMWDSLDRDGDTAALCDSHPGGFDLIIASDCLFFKASRRQLSHCAHFFGCILLFVLSFCVPYWYYNRALEGFASGNVAPRAKINY